MHRICRWKETRTRLTPGGYAAVLAGPLQKIHQAGWFRLAAFKEFPGGPRCMGHTPGSRPLVRARGWSSAVFPGCVRGMTRVRSNAAGTPGSYTSRSLCALGGHLGAGRRVLHQRMTSSWTIPIGQRPRRARVRCADSLVASDSQTVESKRLR
jgi:hypothetical protein